MEKEKADKIITEYLKKIYGFSLLKTENIDHAEELSAKIVYEVYNSLLKSDKIFNINSYIYRIAQNVASRYLNEEQKNKKIVSDLSNDEVPIIETNIEEELDQDDNYTRLRNEIHYLSRIQREVIVLHYFDKLKLNEIAEKLNIPNRTVRWHLSEARNQLKNGFVSDTSAITPFNRVEKSDNKLFTQMGFLGSLGLSRRDMTFYFSDTLSQHIAISSYHKAKSTVEIAREFSVPEVFVADKIDHLLENGFMEEVQGNKYLTNIYISEENKEKEELIKKILQKYAENISELFIPLVTSFLLPSVRDCFGGHSSKESRNLDGRGIYIPENDINFFLWSLISFVTYKKFIFSDKENDIKKFISAQKNGERYLAVAKTGNKERVNDQFTYDNYDLTLNNIFYPLKIWSFFSKRHDEKKNATDWFYYKFENLYQYMKGEIPKTASNIVIYKGLYDRDLLVTSSVPPFKRNMMDFVNIVITTMSENDFLDLFPQIPEKIKKIGKKLDEEMYKINKKYFPTHKHDLCRIMNKNILSGGQFRTHLLDILIKKNILKPLKKRQLMTVNTIMFADELPLVSRE